MSLNVFHSLQRRKMFHRRFFPVLSKCSIVLLAKRGEHFHFPPNCFCCVSGFTLLSRSQYYLDRDCETNSFQGQNRLHMFLRKRIKPMLNTFQFRKKPYTAVYLKRQLYKLLPDIVHISFIMVMLGVT